VQAKASQILGDFSFGTPLQSGVAGDGRFSGRIPPPMSLDIDVLFTVALPLSSYFRLGVVPFLGEASGRHSRSRVLGLFKREVVPWVLIELKDVEIYKLVNSVCDGQVRGVSPACPYCNK
jgi:hypothetical protein